MTQFSFGKVFAEMSRCAHVRLLAGFAVLWLAMPPLRAQQGPLYYALEELSTGTILQRGTMSAAGIPARTLILSGRTTYRHWVFDPATGLVGSTEFTTPASGRAFNIPPAAMTQPATADYDGDGLPDDAEFILGTNPNLMDSDDDGIDDGAEIAQGLNPLDGLIIDTGIIANGPTQGPALDICAVNDIAVVATGDEGIAVFNIYNGMFPVIIAQVDTPGDAKRVHCSGSLVAVADGTVGLTIVDITDPPAARVTGSISQAALGGPATSVVTSGGLAYVGTGLGNTAVVDLASATVLDRFDVRPGVAVQDLAIEGDRLFILSGYNPSQTRLHIYQMGGSLPLALGNFGGFSRRGEYSTQSRRLFVGGNLAYVTSYPGYDVIDVTNPATPVRLSTATDVGPTSFKDIVVNGSGLGVAAVGTIEIDLDPNLHQVYLYDVSDPAVNSNFQTVFPTPSRPQAVAIYNGLAYVADLDAGLQVISFIPYDNLGMPPAVQLGSNLPDPPEIEEGKTVRLTASVSDDIQVRNVEFYLDGEKVHTDGNFPFEFRFSSPKLANRPGTSFTVAVRASDTGGNATWSDPLEVQLTPDATAPRLLAVSPRNGSIVTQVGGIAAFFDEPMDPATFSSASFSLVGAGPDGFLDTADDAVVSATVEWRDEPLGAFLKSAAPLGTGLYRATLADSITDLAGNALEQGFSWTFRAFPATGIDSDGDGLPDDWEIAAGMDPNNPDGDGDSIFDGVEDNDGDGLNNLEEFFLGSDPNSSDSDGNGIGDAAEDFDRDGLRNIDELLVHGTDFAHHDSDLDGFPDANELADGSNPLSPASIPPVLFQERYMPEVSLFNNTAPSVYYGRVHGSEAAVFQALRPELFYARSHGLSISIEDQEAPELVLGHAEARVFSIEAQDVGGKNAAAPTSASSSRDDE